MLIFDLLLICFSPKTFRWIQHGSRVLVSSLLSISLSPLYLSIMPYPKATFSFLLSSDHDTEMAEAGHCLEHHLVSDGSKCSDKAKESSLSVRSWKRWWVLLSTLSSIVAVCLIYFTYGMMLEKTISGNSDQPSHLQTPVLQCRNPTMRREWRSLDRSEKAEYITAVNCLRALPSGIGLNQTLYDDFPLIHSQNGNNCESPCIKRLYFALYSLTLR